MSKLKSLSKSLEFFVLSFCVISILSLCGIQFFKITEDTTPVFSSQGIEYQLLNMNKINKSGYIILEKLDKGYDDVEVIINNEKKHCFNQKDELTLEVFDGDFLEVNGSMYNENINFKVSGVTKNIQQPKLDSYITTTKSMEMLGSVQLNNLE